MKRFLGVFIVGVMAIGAAVVVVPAEAHAKTSCVADVFFENPADGSSVSAIDLLDRQGLTKAGAIALLEAVTARGVPLNPVQAQLLAFYSQSCGDALPYPGAFTNMPTTPSAPYGFGSQPV